MPDDTAFTGLEPVGLWRHFAALTRIPRPSRHEGQVVAYVRAWADQHQFPVLTDAAGNLCVQVPGRLDRTRSPVVVLQGHLDMVCERDSTSPYDAERGNIHPVRDGDWIRAEGTTLGADNGIGVAAMLHAAEDAGVVRGPLDLLFTIDEETGLTGALSLDPAIVRGRVLLNLDNEDDGELCVGCAGSTDATVTTRLQRSPVPPGWSGLRVRVGGLAGGHSGIDIIKPRLNAIRALARVLRRAATDDELRLAALDGGNKRNAIPREASAVVFLPHNSVERVRAAIEQEADDLRKQFAGRDDGLTVWVEPTDGPAAGAWEADGTRRLLDLVLGLPCGVLAMSPAVPGLVETSNNIGTAGTDGDEVRLGCLIRSSHKPASAEVTDTIRSVARLAGAEVGGVAGYPGWQPDLNSR
ncbi:MAG TPA: beta-Ala-His dipeptidase, partial [Urbifossiella sp.]|nr:beta-Ala-His dipeptidase [Urbifossiella sp.]